MGDRKIVIYDSRVTYAQRLVDYIENNGKYGIVLFTCIEKLEAYIRGNLSSFYLLEDDLKTRQLISRYEINALMISDDKELNQIGPYRFVYRYIPVSDLLYKVDNLMCTEKKEDEEDDVKVFAYIALDGRMIMDNMFALASREHCDNETRTIVFDFRYGAPWDEIYGIENKFGIQNGFIDELSTESSGCNYDSDIERTASLANVIYAAREQLDNLQQIITDSIQKIGCYDVVYGLVEEQDITHIMAEDIDMLVRTVISMKNYSKIIIISDYYLCPVLSGSIACAGMISVERSKEHECFIRKKYEKRGIYFSQNLILEGMDRELDMKINELLFMGGSKLKEVVFEFVKKGML